MKSIVCKMCEMGAFVAMRGKPANAEILKAIPEQKVAQ